MFTCTQMGGLDTGFPDTCNTPSVTGVTPITYPNLCQGLTAAPPCVKTFFSGCPGHHMNTLGTISNGDEAGVALGVASLMVMSPDRKYTAAFTVLVEAQPATKMTSISGQNGLSMNVPGAAVVPAQVKVMMLK